MSQAVPFSDLGALVAVDGLALAGVFNGDTLQLGLAESGGELQLIDSFAHRTRIHLSDPKDNRVLLSFTEQRAGTWGTPTSRVSTSVVSVTGGPEVISEGGGGAGGEAGAGDAAGDGGGDTIGNPSSQAGGPSASDGGEPSDNSAGSGGEPSSARKPSLSRSCGCRTVGGADQTSGAAALALLAACALGRRRSKKA